MKTFTKEQAMKEIASRIDSGGYAEKIYELDCKGDTTPLVDEDTFKRNIAENVVENAMFGRDSESFSEEELTGLTDNANFIASDAIQNL